MANRKWPLLALIALILVPSSAAKRPLTVEELLAGLQGWLDGTRSLQGGFEQSLLSGALGSEIDESGRLYIERPGRMRWDYLEPERKSALVDGDRTWLYLEDEAELMLGRLGDQGELFPRLLTGEGRLSESFDAQILSLPRRQGRGVYQLQLVPKGGDEAFENVVLLLRPPEFSIEAAEVLDATGNRITYRFTGMERNGDLPEGLFRLDPPEGTLVMGEH